MAARRFFLTLCALWSIPASHCEFVVPRSDVADYKQSWNVGSTLNIAWKSGWSWGNGTQPDRCDVWIMWAAQNGYHERILEDVSLNSEGKLDWKINVTSERATQDPKFVLRFVNHTGTDVFPTGASPMMPSRQFYLYPLNAAGTSSPTASVSDPTSDSSSIPIATGSVVSSHPSSGPARNHTVSAGVIAGGVLGGLAGLALILGGVLLILRRFKRKRESASTAYEEGDYRIIGAKDASVRAHVTELHHEPAELGVEGGHHQTHELQGSRTA